MSITYNTSVINQRLQVVVTAIQAGSSYGRLRMGTSGMASVICSLVLSSQVGTISSGVLTFIVPVTDGSAALSGSLVEADITDYNGTVVASGITVSSGSGDIVVSQAGVTAGDIVTLTSATITGT